MQKRIEYDSLGAVEVPVDALFGAHTVRAIENFRVSGRTLHDRPELLVALAQVKAAAARANATLGVLEHPVAEAIVSAAREVVRGLWHDEFPADLVQGGGGTATNMNMNEVLANRACELLGGRRGGYDRVHPNDHVNRSQSTNDVYPTALALAAYRLGREVIAALEEVSAALEGKGSQVEGLSRLGRTCLQDALPVPAGAVHRAQASAVRRSASELADAIEPLVRVPLGATAVGSGLGAPLGYGERAVQFLAEETGVDLVAAENLFDALAHLDPYSRVADSVSRAMLVLGKLASDLRFLSSGPHGGVGEVRLRAVQVGSSCMPGKVNPVIPELVLQVGFQVRGAARAVELAVAAGELELNVMEPVIASELLGALHDAARAARLFARCLSGLEWDLERVRLNLAGSYEAAVRLASDIGYDAAGERFDPRQ